MPSLNTIVVSISEEQISGDSMALDPNFLTQVEALTRKPNGVNVGHDSNEAPFKAEKGKGNELIRYI